MFLNFLAKIRGVKREREHHSYIDPPTSTPMAFLLVDTAPQVTK